MRSKKRSITIRIFTERFGLPFPFGTYFPRDDDPDDDLPEDSDEEAEEDVVQEDLSLSLPDLSDPAAVIGTIAPDAEPERSEFFAEGRMVLTDDRVDVIYEENVMSGMEDSVTNIGFSRSEPSVVTMLRQGFVNTALVFEEGKRHICVYNTPFSSFEMCVHSLKVRNTLLENGTIELDYISEFHGARTERCKMKIIVE